MEAKKLQRFADIPILNGLSPDEIARVIESARVLRFKQGDYVVRMGEEGREMFVILSGSVKAEKEVGGLRQEIARFEKGQIFGEIAFMANMLRTANIVAAEDLQLLVISRDFMQKLIEDLPGTAAKILFNLSLTLCERLGNTTRSWMEAEYENILILFQTMAMETEIEAVFQKFREAITKAIPKIIAVQLITGEMDYRWSQPEFTIPKMEPHKLDKISGFHFETKKGISIYSIQHKDRAKIHVLLTRETESPALSSKETALFKRVSIQLALVIDRILLYEETKMQATTDALTGLANRNVFKKEINKEIMRSKRYDHPLAMLVSDLDHFKKVNDTYGHLAGDATLRAVADLFNKTVRQTDLVCRYGGEEFAVLLPMTGIQEALMIAERLREGVEKLKINFEGAEIHITASIGVAIFEGESQEKFFEKADNATYEAKTEGRNMVSAAKTAV